MVSTITTVVNIAKEVRLFLTFIASLSLTSALNWDIAQEYMYVYNMHLALLIVVLFYIHHKASNNRHRVTEHQVEKLILENTKTQIRAEIRQAYNDYKEIETIEFETTIKYLTALNKKRVDLGINSYTDEMMSTLLSKVKIL